MVPVPPLPVAEAVPLEPPLQLMLVEVTETLSAVAGCVIVVEPVAVHPPPSVAVTV